LIGACKIAKIEPLPQQFFTAYFGLSAGVQFDQYPSVFPQCMVNVPDVIGIVTVEPVVKGDAAQIRAELLVGPAMDCVAAFKTGSDFSQGRCVIFFGGCHKRN
jgi:hypothetical protein